MVTEPLAPPPRKDPQERTLPPLSPPDRRSRAADAMSAWAARGVLALQTCAECGTVAYPPRDACPTCLSTDLPFRPVDGAGEIVARSTIRTAIDPYFRARMPWRVATVRLPSDVSVIAHLHGDVGDDDGSVRLVPRLDRAGNVAFVALPVEDTPHMHDDPTLREFSAHPRLRRVLVTDARTAIGQAVVEAMLDAGAAHVFAGVAEDWKPFAGRERLERENVAIVPLDVTDTRSCTELAGEIGGKVDILVNTARHQRPGGVADDLAAARDAMEVNALGLMRLARAFGPGMAGRGADGTNNAVAFATLLSVGALAPGAANAGGAQGGSDGLFDASQAAAHSVVRSLRSDLRGGGVRVVAIFAGPLDDDWNHAVAPPKVAAPRLARETVRALVEGVEEAFVGDVARDFADRWMADPAGTAKELAR